MLEICLMSSYMYLFCLLVFCFVGTQSNQDHLQSHQTWRKCQPLSLQEKKKKRHILLHLYYGESVATEVLWKLYFLILQFLFLSCIYLVFYMQLLA